MMRFAKALAITLLVMSPGVAAARPTAAPVTTLSPEQRARNLRDFDTMVEKLRVNYAGWDTKVTASTKPTLDDLTARLRSAAATASDDRLEQILRDYIGFFRDRHTQVGRAPSVATPGKTEGKADAVAPPDYPALSWTEAAVRARLAALGPQRDPLEGIWRIGGGRYRVGILRTGPRPTAFAAVVLTTTADNWKAGQIKAQIRRGADGKLEMTYRPGDHSENHVGAEVVGDGAAIRVVDWGLWSREVPGVADPDLVARLYPSDDMFLKRLSPTTLWLRIPDFNDTRAKALAALIAEHAGDLATSSNLVIDTRDNGGGSDFVYEPLQPLLYSRPVYSVGIEMRSSPENIALRQATADRIRGESPDTAKLLDDIVALMKANPGAYVRPNPAGFSIDRRAGVLPFPKRIAILIDGAGSTGEQFLLEARQSRKVTLFGQRNSAGVLDFANVEQALLPSGRYGLSWATSRSLRLPDDPVDPDGIAPDIRIPADVKDPVTFAQSWLERQVD